MELKINIYKTRLCREVEKTVTANAFELSTGICEDVLNIINIDLFEGGFQALSDESQQELAIDLIKKGYPFFIQLIKEIFELTDDECKCLAISEIARVVMDIVKYAFSQLANPLGGKNSKN